MVYLKGIHLMATTSEELHKTAEKFMISRSWFHSTPEPHYEIVHPIKADEIAKFINKRER